MFKKVVTAKDIAWLDSRGGRNIGDVEEDQTGVYVLMGGGTGRDIKYYWQIERNKKDDEKE